METTHDIKVTGNFKDYYNLLNKGLHYLPNMLQDFKFKRLVMMNKYMSYFIYNSEGLVCIISSLTSQLHIASRHVTIKYVGLVLIYKIISPHNYLLIT